MADHRMTFSGPMVRALLALRKTQTRRIITRQNSTFDGGRWPKHANDREFDWAGAWVDPGLGDGPYLKLPWPAESTVHRIHPKWQVGDLIAVTETYWSSGPPSDRSSRIVYRATNSDPRYVCRPPFALPRWASRITLVVEDVWPERVQDMEGQHASESDALAEGVYAIHHGEGLYYYSAFRNEPHPKNCCDPTDAFRELWNSIHGPNAWDRNDSVWAITFKPYLCNIDQLEPTNG